MAKVKVKGGAGSGRTVAGIPVPRTTGQAHRSAGTELINQGLGKAVTKSPVLLRPARAFFDGAIGKTYNNGFGRGWMDKNGELTYLNPWQKQLRRMKANANTLMTGRRTHAGTGEVLSKDKDAGFLKRQWNRAWAVPHAVSNATLGMGLATAGWAARIGVGAIGYGSFKAAQKIIPGAARLAWDTAVVGGEIVKGGTMAMRAPGVGDAILAGTIGAVGFGGLALSIGELGGASKNFNGYASSLSGTTGFAQTPLVNTGADGDLVFAMHKMR